MSEPMIIENLDFELENNSDKTENDYLEMANDFKDRMKVKNLIIHKLQKKIIMIWGLLNCYLKDEDEYYLEDLKELLEKSLKEDIGIQDID